MTQWPVHAQISRPDRDDRLRLDRPRHAAADRAPFRLRQVAHSSCIDPDDEDRRRSATKRGIRFIQQARDQGELPRGADAAAHRRRPGLLRQPVGRHLLGRHHGALQRARRALHRHRHRAVARLLFRHSKGAGRALELRAARDDARRQARAPPGATTAVSCCGANPGMVSWFVKQALLDVAADLKLNVPEPKTAGRMGAPDAAGSASRASTSPSATPSARKTRSRRTCSSTPGRSRASCRKACSRPSSAGARMRNGCRRTAQRHETGCGAAIYLMQPGANTRVRSWCPTRGAQYGFLVTHNESISIADYFTVRDARARSVYRPTCHYAYHPATTRCCRCTRCSARRQDAGEAAHPRRERDRRRHRRARRAALRPRQERLLVRLAALHRGDAASSRLTRTPPACR